MFKHKSYKDEILLMMLNKIQVKDEEEWFKTSNC